MNIHQRKAIETAINNAQDNLERARLQKKANPNWVTGNGETVDQMIAGYQKRIDDLKEGM